VGTAEARLREKTGAAGSQLIAGPARRTGARGRFWSGPWSPLLSRFKSQADTRALMTNSVLVKRAWPFRLGSYGSAPPSVREGDGVLNRRGDERAQEAPER
jgi:hypothetical protein